MKASKFTKAQIAFVLKQEKVASVRRLHRTSLPIPYAKGVYPAKPLIPILGGLLTFESEWSPALGPSFEKALVADKGDGRLDIGCVASHGHFFFDQTASTYTFIVIINQRQLIFCFP